jgi:hypothetical protein
LNGDLTAVLKLDLCFGLLHESDWFKEGERGKLEGEGFDGETGTDFEPELDVAGRKRDLLGGPQVEGNDFEEPVVGADGLVATDLVGVDDFVGVVLFGFIGGFAEPAT